MVERNELSRSVLALLDENIADALKNDQVRFIFFTEDVEPILIVHYRKLFPKS